MLRICQVLGTASASFSWLACQILVHKEGKFSMIRLDYNDLEIELELIPTAWDN